jgi:hypothetical protein
MFLRQIFLSSIGTAASRFDPLHLALVDADGLPTDAVLWLVNGGGKTSLFALFFSHILPHENQFLGREGGKALDQYVLGDETGHVIAEWFDASSGKRLVTGMVLERATSAAQGGRRLDRRFYLFEPADHMTSLEALPTSVDGRRLGLGRYLEAVEASGLAKPPGVRKAEAFKQWDEILRTAGLDSQLIRYQRGMNTHEGHASAFLNFGRSAEEFVSFLLDVAAPDQLVERVAENLRKVGDRMAELPNRQRDLAFCRDALPLLTRVLDLATQRHAAAAEEAAAAREAARLRGAIARRAAQLAEQDEALNDRLQTTRKQLRDTGIEAGRFASIASNYRFRAANLRVAAMEERAAAAQAAATEADAIAAAWTHVDTVDEREAAFRRLADVERALEGRPTKHEVTRTAGELAAALTQHADARDRDHDLATEAGRLARDEARRVRDEADSLNAELGAMRFQLGQLKDVVARTRGALDAARGRGVLAPDESARTVAALIAGELSTVRGELLGTESIVPKLREEAHTEAERAAQAALLQESRRGDTNQLKTEIERWEKADGEVRLSELYRALSEDDNPRFEATREPVVERLRFMVAAAEDELRRLGIDSTDDRRWLSAVEADGLMPPAIEVTAVVDAAIAAGLTGVYAGFVWIARSVPLGSQEEAVRRCPHLASGVVVREDQDVAKVVAAASAASVVPGTAIVVGPARLFDEGQEGQLAFVAPDTALYDDVAAAAGKEDRVRRQTERAAREAELAGDKARGERLRLEIDAHAQEWPAARVDALRSSYAAAQAEYAQAIAETARLAELGLQARENYEQAESRARRCRDRVDESRARLEMLDPLKKAEQQEADASAQIPILAQGIEGHARRASELHQRAEEEDRIADAQAQRAAAARADAMRWRDDLLELGALVEDPLPRRTPTGTIAELRDAYTQARARDDAKLSDTGLNGKRDSALDALTAADRRLAAIDVAIIEEARRLRLTPDGADRVSRDVARVAAVAAATDAAKGHQYTVKELDEARRAMPERPPAIVLPEDSGYDLGATEALATQYFTRYQRREAERAALDSSVNTIKAEATRVNTEKQVFDGYVQSAPEAAPVIPDISPFDGDAAAAGTAIAAMGQRTEHARATLQSRFIELATALQAVASLSARKEYQGVGVKADRMSQAADGPWLREAAEYHDDIDRQIPWLEQEVATLSQDRQRVLEQLADAVLEGFSVIRRASSRSMLPDELEGWRGLRFLDIQCQAPRTRDELLGRLDAVLRNAIVSRSTIGAKQLLINGVKAANTLDGFTVTVLKPDTVLSPGRHDVSELRLWSGGQQLTAAVVLYCILARLRRQPTARRAATGVLLLDNPLGTANHVTLLDVQHRVARIMGVQVVVTTGLNDLSALETFTLKIRLRRVAEQRRRRQHVARALPDGAVDHRPTVIPAISIRRVAVEELSLPVTDLSSVAGA